MSKKRIVIIGGLSAGPATAAKARRMDEEADIKLFEKDSLISYATCGMPYALSKKIKTRDKLIVVKPELLQNRFKIDMHLSEEVLSVDPIAKTVTTSLGVYPYDSLIYAAGARPVLPPVAGLEVAENRSFLRTMSDFDKLMGSSGLEGRENITILGAGLIGVEIAENLQHIGKKVAIVEGASQILPMFSKDFAESAQAELESNGVSVFTGQFAQSYTEGTLILQDGAVIPSDYLIVAAGIKPVTEMLTEHGAETLPNGALIVNEKMETSIPGIYAAGDCAAIPNKLTGKADYFPLGTHSNKGGRTAAINALGGNVRYTGGYGTAIVQVFDYTLARTGWSQKAIAESDYTPVSTYISAGATPGYYPGQEELFLEVIFDKESGVLLSAEGWGKKGVDKRIDVLATALYAGLTIEDLHDLDLAYAPPFSPAKDPVVVAGYVGSNQKSFGYQSLSNAEFASEYKSDSVQVVDVRTAGEYANGAVSNALNIPLDDLRDNLNVIPKDKKLYVYCAKGLRGYLASQILMHSGFTVYNLAGGYNRIKDMAL